MLDNMKEGDVIDDEGTMDELKNSIESALPKISKWLKDEQDQDKIDELEEVKSIIKGVVLKFQDIKHGRYDTSYDISGKYRSIKDDDYGAKTAPPQAISLIDLDDLDASATSPSSSTNASTVQKNAFDELTDIFGEKTTISSPPPPANASTSNDIFDLLSQPSNTTSTQRSASSQRSVTPISNASSSPQPAFTSPKQESVLKSSK